MNKNIKPNYGDIIEIKLENGKFCYVRILKPPLLAFYNLNTKKRPTIEKILSSNILFKIWVMDSFVKSENWKIIGTIPLEEDLLKPIKFFKQDIISKKLFLYIDSEETPATLSECEGLERAAVWSPEHVEDRLKDYFAGISNKWVESLKYNKYF